MWSENELLDVSSSVDCRSQSPRVAGSCPGRPRGRFYRGGFSLLELMVVLMIIGLLAGLITANVRGRIVLAKQNVAKFDIATIADALETFYMLNSRYPTSEEGLRILTQPSPGSTEPLLEKLPNDPWGFSYEYITPGTDHPYEVISLGGDGQEGGIGANADINNWQIKRENS